MKIFYTNCLFLFSDFNHFKIGNRYIKMDKKTVFFFDG